MALQIVVDDAGAVASIDDAVERLLDYRAIDAASVITTYHPILKYRSFRRRGLSVGIHFNISSGGPVASARQIPTLVDPRTGCFLNPLDCSGASPEERISAFCDLISSRLSREDLLLEFQEQLQRFVAGVGATPDFVSVHHDLDTLEVVRQAAEDVARMPTRQSRLADGSLYSYEYRLHGRGIMPSQVLTYISEYVDAANQRPQNLFEFICHPATSVRGLSEFTMYQTQRVAEYQALLDFAQAGATEVSIGD